MVKHNLPIEFVPQELTSYSDLELLRRYLQQIDLPGRLRRALGPLGSDTGTLDSVCWSWRCCTSAGAGRASAVRRRRSFGASLLRPGASPNGADGGQLAPAVHSGDATALSRLNHDLVTDAITRLELPRLTIDVDGTVVRTGATVGWASRLQSHHRKDPSYYPLLAHLAQTGHILRLKNRPGNVHDSTQAVGFLRGLISDLRTRLGRRVVLEFRMDAAFFQRDVFRLLAGRGCGYAIKVGYWSWLPLKRLAAETRHWVPIAPDITACGRCWMPIRGTCDSG